MRIDSTGAETPIALPPGRYAAGRPAVTPDGATVLVAAAAVVPGVGTTPPGLSLDLVTVDAATGAVTATVPAVLPWAAAPTGVSLRVAGVAAGVAVVVASTGDRGTTVGVDLLARRVLWISDGLRAETVLADGPTGGVAVGAATAVGESPVYTAATVVGLDVVSGVRRFAGEQVRAPRSPVRAPASSPSGPGPPRPP